MRILTSLFLLFVALSLFSQEKSQNTIHQDIDLNNLSKLIDFSDSVYADEVMVIYKDKVIKHWKSGRCDSLYFNTASMLKSWTGLVIGIMVDQGLISSEHDLICKYLPEWKDGCDKKVTIKNLLTMTAGFKRRGPRGILSAEDAKTYALTSKLDTIPNVKFGYSNVSAQLLGLLINKLTKKDANQYFEQVLFKPLGMDSTTLNRDFSKNSYLTYGGAKTTIQDASKVGLLIKNKGAVNGKQIVSESWINKTISRQYKFSEPYGYGYLWWVNDEPTNAKVYSAMGDLGKLTLVYPDLDLIFLSRQTCDKTKFRRMEWMSPDFYKSVASIIKSKN